MSSPLPRILFLDHAGALGGAELYLLDLARHYRPTSTVALFETGPFYDRLRAEGIDAEVLPASPSLLTVRKQGGLGDAVRALPALARLGAQVARRARDYDLVFLNSQKALLVGAVAAWWAGRPALWNLHDMLTADHFSPLNRRAAVLCANWGVDRVIANSRATADAFRASGGTVPDLGIVYNGIDASAFDAVPPSHVAALRHTLGLADGPVLGVFSRLAPWKGQDVLLRALPALPDAQVLFVGGALFGGDEQYEATLHGLARQLGVADRVRFLGFRDDIPTLMTLVDVVVHTSTAPEPFGRVIVEGMLARTPVVATAAGGAREIITSGEDGLLVPPGDPDALREALSSLLEAPAKAARLACRGRRTAETRFSRAAMIEQVETQVAATLSRASSFSTKGTS